MRNRASIVYDKETHKKFKKYCEAHGYKISSIIKIIIEDWLEKNKKFSTTTTGWESDDD